MPRVVLEYDGDRNPWSPENLISMQKDEPFYAATKEALLEKIKSSAVGRVLDKAVQGVARVVERLRELND